MQAMRGKPPSLLWLAVVCALLALASAGPADESGCPKLASVPEFDTYVQVCTSSGRIARPLSLFSLVLTHVHLATFPCAHTYIRVYICVCI